MGWYIFVKYMVVLDMFHGPFNMNANWGDTTSLNYLLLWPFWFTFKERWNIQFDS